MLQFLLSLKDYPSPNVDFAIFWQWLLTGTNDKSSYPDLLVEIFSYICDDNLLLAKTNLAIGNFFWGGGCFSFFLAQRSTRLGVSRFVPVSNYPVRPLARLLGKLFGDRSMRT